MNHPQTFAQRHPFYMTAETTQRTIELGRALRAQIQRRRNSVTINIQVDSAALDTAVGNLLQSTKRSAV